MNQKKKRRAWLLTIYRNIRQCLKDCRSLLFFSGILFLIFSLGMTQKTLGRLSHVFQLTDSAFSAKFDVEIEARDELWAAQGDIHFEYYFISGTDIKVLPFQITNNGETDVLCIPHINGGILYRVFVSGTEKTEFVVRTKETVDFQIHLSPEGLSGSEKEVNLFFDILQIEGE